MVGAIEKNFIMLKVIVLGSGGQLGGVLTKKLRKSNTEVAAFDSKELDIRDTKSVIQVLDNFKPEYIINCAAYTNVDKAEIEPAIAYEVNGDSVSRIATNLRNYETKFIQISTDYVFDGLSTSPYKVLDQTNPQNVYGKSKRIAEESVLEFLPNTGFVLRTAWLYGRLGNNFRTKIISKAKEGFDLTVVDDQFGQPTLVDDLASQLLKLLSSESPSGIYHGSNSGEASWFDFASEILRREDLREINISPIKSTSLKDGAKRPKYSVLDNSCWELVGLSKMRDWKEALASLSEG